MESGETVSTTFPRVARTIGLLIVAASVFALASSFSTRHAPDANRSSDLAPDDAVGSKRAGSSVENPLEAGLNFTEAVEDRTERRYDTARSSLTAARSLVDRSEREVEELERFIEALEARGEDPADHAEEGMLLFLPAFEAYETAVRAFEEAEREEARARFEWRRVEQKTTSLRTRLASSMGSDRP